MALRSYIGLRSGLLAVVGESRAVESGASRVRVTCLCDCGKTVTCLAQSIAGKRPRQSCGCATDHTKKHGHAPDSGQSPTYRSWMRMRGRMRQDHKHFANYGGRGIKICDRWNVFENFLADMGARPVGHTLDRVDNDGDYEPGNCKWSTRREQQNNRRVNHRLTAFGRTQTLTEWARERGMNATTLHCRLRAGTPLERALDPAAMPTRNAVTKLDESMALAIRNARAAGASVASLAKQYGVSSASVSDICAGRTWASAGGPLTISRGPRSTKVERKAA